MQHPPRRRSSLNSAAAAAATSKVQAMIGAVDSNWISPHVHLSMLVHPDGVALYAKMQTDPFFRESIVSTLQRAGGAITRSANSASQGQQGQRAAAAAAQAAFAEATSLRAQLASNKAIVDVARAAYQHPTTAPVLRFQMPFAATPESIATEGIGHFKELLYEMGHVEQEQYESDDFEDLIPCTDPDDLEVYVYHVEDPDLVKAQQAEAAEKGAPEAEQQQQLQVIGKKRRGAGAGGGSNKDAVRPTATMSHVASQGMGGGGMGGAVAAGAASRVSHRAITIGDYQSYPPLTPDVPIRVQLNLFQLIAAARKRRRKFIVRSGLHPSAVDECSPLNIYCVLAIGPKWLERRALEVQEETAREMVAKNEGRYMLAIHEAHAVSHNRATNRARGHKQLRCFQGEVEALFIRLALRDAMVKQASMNVQDVVATHMKQWPEAMKGRESFFQEGLKTRRCLLADFSMKLKMQKKLAHG